MNKTDYIMGCIALDPSATTHDISKKAKCTQQMVNYVRRQMVSPIEKDSIVGVFGDNHEPACHPRFFDFVRDTFKAHGVNQVVCLGDLVDHHFISRHISEPDALSPVDELELAIDNLKKWTEEFPNVKCCIGNHDAIPVRQAKELGIPKEFIRLLNDVYKLPAGWEWRQSWEIDGVLYEHGLGATGMYGFKNLALAYRQSVVVGHTHSNAGVLYVASPKDIIFGANAGCGVDAASYAMRYGSSYKFKPTIGCVIVKNGKEAQFIPMDTDKYRR